MLFTQCAAFELLLRSALPGTLTCPTREQHETCSRIEGMLIWLAKEEGRNVEDQQPPDEIDARCGYFRFTNFVRPDASLH